MQYFFLNFFFNFDFTKNFKKKYHDFNFSNLFRETVISSTISRFFPGFFADYDLMDSASDIESTTLFVEYDTDFIPTTTAEPELATYPINLPGYGDDDKENDLLPGYGEDGGDENLSGYGEDSTEAANLGDDDNLPKYEEDDDQSNQIEAQLLPNYSESDNSLANYNENSQEAAAAVAYLPPEENR